MFDKILTYYRLGLRNLFAVALYRIAIKLGYFAKTQPIDLRYTKTEQQFWDVDTLPININLSVEAHGSPLEIKAFGWLNVNTESSPNWLSSVIDQQTVSDNQIHWSDFNEFALNIGDIKTVWELSRFSWVWSFALAYRQSNNPVYINKLNEWLNNWCQQNPVNQGVNWRCGQEASIRVMHIAAACQILGAPKTLSPALAEFISNHLTRIAPTRFYAMAQDNNHGTSEACALFIGGALLINYYQEKSTQHKQALKWCQQGRYWLENRAKHLIDDDGLFSQFSVNYHRLMLDTLSLAEQIRRNSNQPSFSAAFYHKAKLASQWLYQLTHETTGDVPNIGANDGAQLLPLTSSTYRDFRPSVQWAYGLFHRSFPYALEGNYQLLSSLLSPGNQSLRHIASSNTAHIHNQQTLSTQIRKLELHNIRAFIKTPQPTFRASSCDGLHLDLWIGELNLLRDAGSYSYNCEPPLQQYFSSTKAHNTVQFDQHEQMPKLSRFLYKHWLKTNVEQSSGQTITARYRDYMKCSHQRHASLTKDALTVIDTISNFKQQAVLRWRLAPSDWQLKENQLVSELGTLTVSADTTLSLALVEGLESRYYLQKNTIPVLEVTLHQPGIIKTIINWSL